MITNINNCHQIGLPTESVRVVKPTLYSPVSYISDDFFFFLY
ncbi:MAG TPA: hypothetical protein PKW14_12905 [Bacteroidota bacterium]|nr:hypothetical protein [Bacteroidota bacterium]